jgi:hypothetical protein
LVPLSPIASLITGLLMRLAQPIHPGIDAMSHLQTFAAQQLKTLALKARRLKRRSASWQ